MLSFLQESRHELQDTHKEIVKEQEVLRDTSDLLGIYKLKSYYFLCLLYDNIPGNVEVKSFK